MRALAAAGCLVLLAGCATTHPAATTAPAPATPDPQLASLQASMTEMLERLDVMNDRITRLEKASEERAQAPQQPSVAPAPSPARAAAGGGATQKPAQTPLRSADIAQAYRNALTLYGKSDYVRARAAFQQVFDADPSSELADNALFWIGGTYYQLGSYNDAIRYYKRVVDEYGDQNKAPDAMYMLALAYEKTSDLGLARTTLQQVIARYPYSAPASSAKSELDRIKY